MAYTKTTWVDNSPPAINAANLNNIENGIEDHEQRIEALEQGGGGLTDGVKQALLQIAQKVAYIDEHGQDYYDDLYNALYAVTAVSVSPTTLNFSTIGSTQQLTATTTPSGASVTWASSNTSIATVDSTGLVTSVAYGTATITATAGGITASCSVVVAQATLTSITAVYTQGGTVYDTDSLDSLKSDLVVTAYYDNSTSAVVPSADYTLSGTLAEGTSTITASYGGKTATFNVTVTHYNPTVQYLYNWDFTQSLTDSVQGQVAELRTGGTDATRDSNGLTFDAATQNVYLGQIDMAGKAIEIDVASFAFAGNTNYHIRFLMNAQYNTSNGYGLGAVIWRSGLGWTGYGYSASDTSTNRAWSANYYDDLSGSTTDIINAFSGKTIKVVYSASGNPTLYIDGVSKGTLSDIYLNNNGSTHIADKLAIGGKSNPQTTSGDQCFNMTITGVRIYENV